MVLHLRLFRSSQESWLSEIVMIMNYPKPKLLLAQAQAASPIFTSYGPSGLRPFNPKYQQQWLMRGEARSRFMSHNYTQNPPFYKVDELRQMKHMWRKKYFHSSDFWSRSTLGCWCYQEKKVFVRKTWNASSSFPSFSSSLQPGFPLGGK